MAQTHPWQSGPTELLDHALKHMCRDSDFDRRLAFLLLDVGVETLLKTFLLLPDSITGTSMSYRDRRTAAEGNFHQLIAGIGSAASSRLQNHDLSHVEYYHSIRNNLYHQGNGITVPSEQVVGYAKEATFLLRVLLDVDLTDRIALSPDVFPMLSKQSEELEAALGNFQDSVALAMEKLAPGLLKPSIARDLRSLAAGLDLESLQGKVDVFARVITTSVSDEAIREWVLELIARDVSWAGQQELSNTRFLFSLLDDPINLYLLIIGAFALPDGNIEKEYLYSQQDLQIVTDSEHHVLGLYDHAKEFRRWTGRITTGGIASRSMVELLTERGQKLVLQLTSLGEALRKWAEDH